MITEKQVREWCGKKALPRYTSLDYKILEFLLDHGILAEAQDKPLLAERFRHLVPSPFGEINELFREHQAALDAFAGEIVKVKELLRDPSCVTREGQLTHTALEAARKAGLTKVGA